MALLSAWRADVVAEPIPELIDLETAVAACGRACQSREPTRSARARHLVPVAAAAAFLVLVGRRRHDRLRHGRARQRAVAGLQGALHRARRVVEAAVRGPTRSTTPSRPSRRASRSRRPPISRRPSRSCPGAPPGGQGRARRREEFSSRGRPGRRRRRSTRRRREGRPWPSDPRGRRPVAAAHHGGTHPDPTSGEAAGGPPASAPSAPQVAFAASRGAGGTGADGARAHGRGGGGPPTVPATATPRAIRDHDDDAPTTGWLRPHLDRRWVERGNGPAHYELERASGVGEHRVGVAPAVLPGDVVGGVGVERRARAGASAPRRAAAAGSPAAGSTRGSAARRNPRSRPRCRARRAAPTTPGTPRDRRDRPPPRRAPRRSTPRARRAPGRRSRARGRADPRRTGPAAAHRVTQRQRYPATAAHPRRRRDRASSGGYDEVVFGGFAKKLGTMR